MKKVFITGSGTLARELTRQLSSRNDVKKIVIYSRDEGKHAEMREGYPEGPPSKIRYRIGDIRDLARLKEAMLDCDTVIHTAAMKRIDDCANHVQECVKTNIIGTMNVIAACEYYSIDNALFISTDKACAPVSAYGASKYMAEHLWIHGNSSLGCNYSICRYGNVIGSRGSVFHHWKKLKYNAELANQVADIPVTDVNATRFFWSIDNAADFALMCVAKMRLGSKNATNKGLIYIPKMTSFSIEALAKEYGKVKEVGFRTAEKVHESLISADEAPYARELDDMYVIYPVYHQWAGEMSTAGKPIGEITSRGI